MDDRQRQLLAHVEQAFAGVELGDGVSLHESHVIDNYGTAEERQTARGPDEKLDWRKLIDDSDLIRYFGIGYSGLCFLDAAGVRFHLPACLSRVVRDVEDDRIGNMFESLYYMLTDLGEYNLGRLAILNDAQRACVREILVYFAGSAGVGGRQTRPGHRGLLEPARRVLRRVRSGVVKARP